MNLKSLVAILAIAALPVCAQAQNAPKPTKAAAQRVFQIISGDKAKTQTYCDIGKLGEQIEQADEKKDTKKVDELSEKADALSKQLGPEFVALMEGLQQLDENSKDGQEIGAVLEGLDKLCGK
jgi:ABC-type transporter Mla subunit MlaD